MLMPYIVTAVFVVSVVTLCIAKPNAGRIFLGLFFIAMGLGVNGAFVLTGPQFYREFDVTLLDMLHSKWHTWIASQ